MHDGRKPVPHEQRIRPDSSGAAVSIGERMNPDPLGIRPPAEIDRGREPVSIQFLAGWVPLVQCRDRGSQRLLESRERAADVGRCHALVDTNANTIGFKPRFATKTPYVRRVRHAKSGHHVAVPAARVFKGGGVAPERCGAHPAKNSDEVLGETRTVGVPVSHESTAAPCAGLDGLHDPPCLPPDRVRRGGPPTRRTSRWRTRSSDPFHGTP